MNNEQKNHYRKVFKSDHLSVADLEDLIEQKNNLIFTIKEVKQLFNHSVAGKKGNFNIAYFNEPIKPLVLNAGNSKIVKYLSGTNESPFVEDWKNIKVQLYIATGVKFGKDVVNGVRIHNEPPKIKTRQVFNQDKFEQAAKKNASIELIKKHYDITPEMEKLYLQYVSGN